MQTMYVHMICHLSEVIQKIEDYNLLSLYPTVV